MKNFKIAELLEEQFIMLFKELLHTMLSYILRALTDMVQFKPPYVLPIFGPFFIIIMIVFIIKNRKTPFLKLLLNLLLLSIIYIYIMGVLIITRIAEIPFSTYERVLDNRELFHSLEFQIIPFESIIHLLNYYGLGTQILGNLLLLLPLGFFLPIFIKSCIGIFKVGLVIMIVSLLIEFLQVLFGVGIGSIDDLLLNTLGGVVGYIILNMGKYSMNKLNIPSKSVS